MPTDRGLEREELAEEERLEVEVLTTKHQKPINDARRFALYSIGCFGALTSSFGYAFNLISRDMQKLLNLTFDDLSDINTVGTTLQYGTFFYSIIYDYLGPIIPVIVAAVTFIVGAVTLALTFRRTIRPTLVRLCVFNGILNLSLLAFEMVADVTVVAHFPTARGFMIPLIKSFVGLGSAIMGTIQLAFFTNPEYFFYFLTALAAVVSVLMCIFLKMPKYHMTGYERKHLPIEEKAERTAYKAQYLRQKPATWRFIYSFTIMIVLIVFLPTQSAVVNYLSLGKNYKYGFAITTIVLVLLLTVVSIPVPSDRKVIEALQRDHFEEHNSQDVQEPPNLIEDVAGLADGADKGSDAEVVEHQPKDTVVDYIAPQYQFTFMQSLATLRYWALFWSIFCFSGAEFNVLNYSSYVYASIDGRKVSDSMSTLLSVLTGVGSAAGRLLIALFENLTQNRPPEKRIPFTWAPMIPATFMLIALILFLCLPAKALPLPFVLLALGNGSEAASTALVPRTIYAKDMAKYYQFLMIPCVLGAIVLMRFLFAEWYSRQAKRNNNTDGYCFGKRCIIMPFCVMLGLICSTFFSNFYISWRYIQFCKKVLAERARLREGAMASEEPRDESEAERAGEMMQAVSKGLPDTVEGNTEEVLCNDIEEKNEYSQ